jgi:hypothetical protein
VRRLFAVALGLTIVVPLMAVMLVFAAASSPAQCSGSGASPVGVSSAPGVPSDLVAIYDQAASRFQLGPTGWAYLAAINEVETDFGHNLSVSSPGRSPTPPTSASSTTRARPRSSRCRAVHTD